MVVLITGSSRGLGFQLGKLLEANGNEVVYHQRKREVMCDVKNIITAELLNKDQLNTELLATQKCGLNIEHLICNAGQSSYSKTRYSGFENIEKALNENVIVTSNAIHSTLMYHGETLKTITIIGSICGEEYIDGAPIEYGIAKSTLKALTKSSAHYLADYNIRCNMITPGNLLFDSSVWSKKLLADRLAVESYLADNVPGAKIGTPEDVYDAIKFVISDDAKFLNGANIVLDGGQTKKW
jgi:3-oxoacyl-[acyl-carrier protein] reductase